MTHQLHSHTSAQQGAGVRTGAAGGTEGVETTMLANDPHDLIVGKVYRRIDEF